MKLGILNSKEYVVVLDVLQTNRLMFFHSATSETKDSSKCIRALEKTKITLVYYSKKRQLWNLNFLLTIGSHHSISYTSNSSI